MPAALIKLAWFPVIKGVTVGAIVIAVVHSQLSPFLQALIIALVSAVIGALGMVIAAYVSTVEARRTQELARKIHGDVRELKRAGGLTKRVGETDEDDSP